MLVGFAKRDLALGDEITITFHFLDSGVLVARSHDIQLTEDARLWLTKGLKGRLGLD